MANPTTTDRKTPAGAGGLDAALTTALPAGLPTCRWFGGKARTVREVRILDRVALPTRRVEAWLFVIEVAYTDGEAERYVLPAALARGSAAARVRRHLATAVLTALPGNAVLCDALWEEEVARALLEAVGSGRRLAGAAGEIVGVPTRAFARLAGPDRRRLKPKLLSGEQSNSSVRYGERLILKLVRKLGDGVSPELEIGRFLTERGFAHVPALAGALEYRRPGAEPATVALLQEFVPHAAEAWGWILQALRGCFERVRGQPAGPPPLPRGPLLAMLDQPDAPLARELLGAYLDAVGLLGHRTAELHRALASEPGDPAFAPELLSEGDRLALFQAMVELADRTFRLLRARLADLPAPARASARLVLQREPAAGAAFGVIREPGATITRLRCHGDYHLGQVLWTGTDFVLIDFEGEPARPLAERRRKRCPLVDVAGLLRSLDYAASVALRDRRGREATPAGAAATEAWADWWCRWASAAFLRGYLEAAGAAPFLPGSRRELQAWLDAFLVEKAVYELAYELNNRPDWVEIPLRALVRLLGVDREEIRA